MHDLFGMESDGKADILDKKKFFLTLNRSISTNFSVQFE